MKHQALFFFQKRKKVRKIKVLSAVILLSSLKVNVLRSLIYGSINLRCSERYHGFEPTLNYWFLKYCAGSINTSFSLH